MIVLLLLSCDYVRIFLLFCVLMMFGFLGVMLVCWILCLGLKLIVWFMDVWVVGGVGDLELVIVGVDSSRLVKVRLFW